MNEKSVGGNLDFNYRTNLGKIGFAINQLFFHTRLNKPLILTETIDSNYEFVNANGFIDTKGMETNLRFTYSNFKLFISYKYADVNSHFDNIKSVISINSKAQAKQRVDV